MIRTGLWKTSRLPERILFLDFDAYKVVYLIRKKNIYIIIIKLFKGASLKSRCLDPTSPANLASLGI